MSEYVCGICGEPIEGEDPHTDPGTGEDVHPRCCPVCAEEECEVPDCVYSKGHVERSGFPHRVEPPPG